MNHPDQPLPTPVGHQPLGPQQRPIERQRVSPWEAIVLSARALAGSIATRGRLAALSAFSLGMAMIAAIVAHNQGGSSAASALRFADVSLYGIALPMFVLFAAAGGLAEARNEGTLVYLWLRPIPRVSIALGAWGITTAVAIPFGVLTATLIPVVFGAGFSAALGALVGAVLATMAYAALFSLVGLLSRFSTAIGLAYILVWESVVGRWGSLPNSLSIRHHALSVARGIAGVRDNGQVPSTATGIIVLVVATAVLLGLTTLRLDHMDVR